MLEPLTDDLAPRPPALGPIAHLLLNTSKLWAAAGGLLFVGLVAMSIVSIVGRKLFSAPVPGDVEVLQMVAASAGASFFAYCHMNQGDVKVDFFTAKAGERTVHRLDAAGSLLFALVGALLTWRTGAGALATMNDGETSAILGWSVGLAQWAMVPGFVLMTLAGLAMTDWHWRQAAGAGSAP